MSPSSYVPAISPTKRTQRVQWMQRVISVATSGPMFSSETVRLRSLKRDTEIFAASVAWMIIAPLVALTGWPSTSNSTISTGGAVSLGCALMQKLRGTRDRRGNAYLHPLPREGGSQTSDVGVDCSESR